jgi:hypothetical protein
MRALPKLMTRMQRCVFQAIPPFSSDRPIMDLHVTLRSRYRSDAVVSGLEWGLDSVAQLCVSVIFERMQYVDFVGCLNVATLSIIPTGL